MATTRIKDISKTTTDLASDTYGVFDGATNGTQKMSRNDMYADWAAAYTAAPTTYKLAPLNSGTNKIDATYLPVSGDTPKGEWNANTNSPSLADGSGTAGDYYDVTTAGSQDLGSGSTITFTVGDVVKYDGSTWYKIDSVANILDGSATAADGRSALSVNSIDEDAEATGTKLVGPALYFRGAGPNDFLEVADDSKLTFSSSAEFGTNSSGTWSPNDNTPALTDGTGTLNQHYRVDSGAGTVTQGGSTLSIINGAATTAGQAVYYDGSVWRLKDVDDLPFSISGFIKADDLTNFPVVSKYTSSEWRLTVNASDKLELLIRDSGVQTSSIVSDNALTTYEGGWVHVACTYGGAGPSAASGAAFTASMSGGNAVLYVNGVSVSSTAADNASYTGMPNSSTPVYIGRQGTTYAKGHIKDVKIFNRELTATEVAQLARGVDLGFADEWGGGTATSGTLTIGKRYRLRDWITGDDFTNVGAGSNADGVEFVATGTTPTTWTNSSVVESIGTLADFRAENYDSDTGKIYDISDNAFVGTSANLPTLTGRAYPVYETGTWTPSVTFGGGSTGITYTTQEGLYTRVGNTVWVSAYVLLSAKGSDTGTALINGLPFTASNTAASSQSFTVGNAANAANLTSAITAYATDNGTTINLVDWGATGSAVLDDTNFAATTALSISGTYQIQ